MYAKQLNLNVVIIPYKHCRWSDDLLPEEHTWIPIRASEVTPALLSALPNHPCMGCGLWGGVHICFPEACFVCLFVWVFFFNVWGFLGGFVCLAREQVLITTAHNTWF